MNRPEIPARPGDEALHSALAESQRLGFLGDRPIPEVVEHARAFVRALDEVIGTVIDLGSGGGVPGLVLATDRPDLDLVLLDRRAKRTDFLARMVLRLRWSDRVTVVNGDAEQYAVSHAGLMDAAVARSFGPPDVTVRLAAQLVRVGGLVIISEPPDGDRWDAELLALVGLERIDPAGSTVIRFIRAR